MQRIAPCLWFDDRAEEAAEFYTGIFKNSRIVDISRYGEAGREFHGKEPGTVMTVGFELDGQPFTALNGGPQFQFSEAVSFQVSCETQEEVDHYWERLGEGGAEGQCGWLKDKFGVSWQVIPAVMGELLEGKDAARSQRVMTALLQMKKLEIDVLKQAYEQE